MSAAIIPLYRIQEMEADPVSIPEPPCSFSFTAVSGEPETWSITRRGRFLGWLRHTPDKGEAP